MTKNPLELDNLQENYKKNETESTYFYLTLNSKSSKYKSFVNQSVSSNILSHFLLLSLTSAKYCWMETLSINFTITSIILLGFGAAHNRPTAYFTARRQFTLLA